MIKTNRLRDAIIMALALSTAAVGTAAAQNNQQDDQKATTLDAVTVTGSRIKRADVEGAMPVTVIDRQELEASGSMTVADYMRDTTFNSFGSYQSTSGSSGGGHTEVSLRGLGGARTLILIDGRRAPVSPMTGGGQDLNSIPMAAVERIEVLSDGASAVYGSDAIGGVVNVITRRDYEGAEITYGLSRPSEAGGDGNEMSVLFGASGERGRVLVGAAETFRDIIFTRDRDYWYSDASPGASTYSNNFSTKTPSVSSTGAIVWSNPTSLGNAGRLRHPTFGAAVPGLCTNGDDSDLFWKSGTNAGNFSCQFNHSATSANLTSMKNTSMFGRGDYQINDDWTVYFSATQTKVQSFGRYAALPSSPWPGGAIVLKAGSPNHPSTPASAGGLNPNWNDPYYQTGTITHTGLKDSAGNAVPDQVVPIATSDLLLYHRFAALGPRDNRVENSTTGFIGGIQGRIGEIDVEFGARSVNSRAINIGQNYVVGGLAQAVIDSGGYNIYNPFAGNPSALGFTTTTNRDMFSKVKEVFGSAAFDLFEMGGGTAAMVVGAEYRQEDYQDMYDLLSASGQVAGSSGASAGGGRSVRAGFAEVLFPIASTFEVNLAARYDSYSDYGADFAPKVSLRWQPFQSLTLRGSYGEGFRAPTLSQVTQQPAFSATATTDRATCIMLTGLPCVAAVQVTTYSISNPGLTSEQSKQWTAGLVWDATDWLSVMADWYSTEITDSLVSVSMATIVGCLRGTVVTCPAGISLFPAGTTIPNPSLGLGAMFDGNNVNNGIIGAQYGSVNLGKVETDGLDLTARANFDLGWGRLRSQLIGTYVNNYSVNGGVNAVGRYGYPEFRANLTNALSVGAFDFSWNINHMDSQTVPATATAAAVHIPSWTIHNVQASVKTPWNGTMTLGINNVGNKAPADAFYSGTSYDYYMYDPWGRVPYFRYTQRF